MVVVVSLGERGVAGRGSGKPKRAVEVIKFGPVFFVPVGITPVPKAIRYAELKLGLFLYGMKVMSDALMELAGDRIRNILSTTTSNRFFAVLTGFTITAVIQSSSATTLMVVSFANASLLTLTEAIGVIMGANIGTTVTAWLISILGFKVSMSAIALPLVGLGFLLMQRLSLPWL